jgi:L-rhamnose-H+ transport protein
MHNIAQGLGLLILAGIMNASFSTPMRFVRTWAWENTWLVWSLISLLLLPCLLAFATVPELNAVLVGSSPVVLLVIACGGAWGVAQVLFGLALERIGIALTFSIVLGLSAAMGSLIPLIHLDAQRLFAPSGLLSLSGIVLVLLGVTASAIAGRERDRSKTVKSAQENPYGLGLLMAVIGGVCASMMNVGFAFGTPLAQAAAEHGASPLWRNNAIWVPLLAGGAVPNIVYCLYLLFRRGSATAFRDSHYMRNLSLALGMGCLWFGSSILYGVATVFLGDMGPAVGWPLFMSLIVIASSLLGAWSGEWKGAPVRSQLAQAVAVVLLVIAVVVLSRATA